jgi:hypothetical protein
MNTRDSVALLRNNDNRDIIHNSQYGKCDQVSVRRCEAWQGKNTFLFGGSLMMGPHAHYFRLTVCLLCVSWILYVACIAPFLHATLHYVYAIVLWSINMILLCLTAFTVSSCL